LQDVNYIDANIFAIKDAKIWTEKCKLNI
jgi:hypothetical protein